jgi:hypothetical protein
MKVRRFLHFLAFTSIAVMTGCKKAERQPREIAAADSTGMMMSDTSKAMVSDTSKMEPKGFDGIDDTSQSPVDIAVRQLSPGQVRYEGPDTMEVGTPANVLVKLARATQFSLTPGVPHQHVVTAPTKIGDSARVCLEADSSDFRLTPNPCATQVVASDTNNVWSWLVRPLRPGERLLNVRVWALLANMPGKAVFDSTYSIVVTVAPRSLAEKVKDALLTWQGILAALGGVVAALALISEKARSLIFGWMKRSDKPPPSDSD